MDRGFNRSLAIDLFNSGRITEKVVEGQQKSDDAQARLKMRLGYMGHLTLIAEEVVKFTERQSPDLLSESVLQMVMAHEWVDYVENSLAETRERDNAILGGVRPDVSVGARQAVMNSLAAGQQFNNVPSAALVNAGLTGVGPGPGLDTADLIHGNGSFIGSYGYGLTTATGGFGRSVDDEETEGYHDGGIIPLRRHEVDDVSSRPTFELRPRFWGLLWRTSLCSSMTSSPNSKIYMNLARM